MSDRPSQAEMAEALIVIGEAFASIIESAAGYRETCIRRGFCETASEMMAVTYHDLLLTRAFELATA